MMAGMGTLQKMVREKRAVYAGAGMQAGEMPGTSGPQEAERYLWLVSYREQGKNRIWWQYFRTREEVEEYIAMVLKLFPEITLRGLSPCPHGLTVADRFYYYTLSAQRLFGEEEEPRRGPRRKKPQASFALDVSV